MTNAGAEQSALSRLLSPAAWYTKQLALSHFAPLIVDATKHSTLHGLAPLHTASSLPERMRCCWYVCVCVCILATRLLAVLAEHSTTGALSELTNSSVPDASPHLSFEKPEVARVIGRRRAMKP